MSLVRSKFQRHWAVVTRYLASFSSPPLIFFWQPPRQFACWGNRDNPEWLMNSCRAGRGPWCFSVMRINFSSPGVYVLELLVSVCPQDSYKTLKEMGHQAPFYRYTYTTECQMLLYCCLAKFG